MTRSVPYQETDRGTLLTVRLTPNARRDAIEGMALLSDDTPVLKVRVRAIPEDNKANKALIKLLAKSLSLPRAELSLAGGQKSRIKKILIEGNSPQIAARIAAVL